MLKKIVYVSLIMFIALAFVTCGGGSSGKTAETGNEQFEATAAPDAPVRNAPAAAQTQSRPGDFGYLRNQAGDGIIITYKTTTASNITIPDRIENLPVVAIQVQTFNGDTSVRAVTLPATITAIPAEAFRNCTNLSSVTMPGVVTVGNLAFRNCSSLSSISLPAAVTIGTEAFRDCSNLTSLNFPVATTIGTQAFQNTKLNNITLPAVTIINNHAFDGLTSLTSVNLPAIVTVGVAAFQNCNNLSKVVFGETLTTIRNHAFFNCINLVEMNVPESLTEFPVLNIWGSRENASNFWNCHKLPLATRQQLMAQGYSGRGLIP